MCEILIRVISKRNAGDVRRDIRLTKRGDIIAAVPDGWQWSKAELNSPDWRILSLPNVPLKSIEPFLSDYPGDDLTKSFRPRRAKFLDVDIASLPGPLKSYLTDSSRADPLFKSNLSAAQIVAFVSDRPPPQDPDVIG